MSEAKHTPGPWSRGAVLNRGECVLAVRQPPHKRIIAMLEWNRDSLTEGANARLISAAPDLLAAAKAKLKDCREDGGCSDAALMPDEYCSNECAALARAVAKAEGRAGQ